MRFSYSAVAVALAAVANAQSIPNVPTCALQCFETALSSDGCASLTDFACHCSKPNLQSQITPCVQQACSPADQQTVANTVAQTCASVGHPITITGTSTLASTSTGSASSSTKTVTTSSTVSVPLGTSTPISPHGNSSVPSSPSPTPAPFTGAAAVAKVASGALAAVVMGAAYLL